MAVHIGEIIQKEVERLKWSEDYFADKIGTTRSNVYNIYKRPNFNTDLLRKISKELGINILQLVAKEMEEEMNMLIIN